MSKEKLSVSLKSDRGVKQGKSIYSLFVPTQGGFSVSSLYAASEEGAIEKATKRLSRDKDRGHDG